MYVKVIVKPSARKEKVEKTGEQSFSIAVREPAERNLANQRIREILADEYAITVNMVRLVTGHRSRGKIFEVTI